MDLSNRERVIIRYLLEQRKGVTVDLLSEKIGVSHRTIYREMSRLEATLSQLNIALKRDKEGYSLEGKRIFFDELEEMLGNETVELSPVQRQSKLIILLLLENAPIKMEALAHDLKISVGTIQSDLQQAQDMLDDYGITIERQKAKGILAEADEPSKRLVISGLISSEINEYDFFQLFSQDGSIDKEAFESIHNPFVGFLDPYYLNQAYLIVSKLITFYFKDASDTQVQRYVILLAVTLERMRKGAIIPTDHFSQKQLDMYGKMKNEISQIMKELSRELENQLDFELPKSEKYFLSQHIETFSDPVKSEFAEDFNITLDYKIRRLVQLVSKDLGWNFNQDETLSSDLMTHIDATVKQMDTRMPESYNPLLDRIYHEYTDLSKSVQKRLKEVFPEVDFLKNEELYVVIHFASAYERIPKVQNLSVLIICSSGVGTGKILENRLRKYLPKDSTITISRISQLNHVMYSDYDLILSTIFLQGFEAEYKVVSPLLMSDEVNSIKAYTKKILNKKQDSHQLKTQFISENYEVKTDFQDFYTYVTIAKNIMNYFDFIPVTGERSITQVLTEASEQLEGVILNDPKQVVNKLENRMEMAAIGLPQTNMALFHTTDESIIEPFFGIVELSEPQSVLAMNSETIELKRILLMLAPEPLTNPMQSVLGTISSSIVESHLNMEVFNSGDKELIINFLSHLFLKEAKS